MILRDSVDADTPQESRMSSVLIEVKNLYKYYKTGDASVHALDGVSFSIQEGEFLAIIGPSGSGKSTLLNMLAGLEKPTKGEIIISGMHLETLDENGLVAFRRKNVGFVFQSYNLLPTMDAVENVALPLMFQGVPKEERMKEAAEYLKLAGLEKQMHHKGNEMSGGQQQRVGIARALVVKPKIIFADEPTGNLDTKTSMEILNLLQDVVKNRHKTLIMVTHDPVIASFAARQIRIVDGKISSDEKNG